MVVGAVGAALLASPMAGLEAGRPTGDQQIYLLFSERPFEESRLLQAAREVKSVNDV